jgi:xanthine dehydrogenase molybdenum-binding subunit
MMGKKLNVVGKSVRKVDSVDKVTGAAKYTSDIYLPGMLIAKLLRSSYAHANIKAINTEKAKALEGVKAVVTWKDVPRIRFSSAGYPKETIPGLAPPTVPMTELEDHFLLDNKARYYGEPIAAVVAVDEQTAKKALELIDVEYEVLDAAYTIEQALAEDAPFIHGGTSKNVIQTEISKGDVEKGLKEADYIFEDVYRTHSQQHVCMEPSCSVAYYEPSGNITLWSTTQVPYHIRRTISEVLGIQMSKIRVVKPALGGGFGERQMVQNELLCVFLSQYVKKPVRLEISREENISLMARRHPAHIKIKSGVKKDGTIVALDIEVKTDAGAYTGHSPYVTKAMCTKIPYRVPNVMYRGNIVYTNLPESGAYRGYGNPQISFARECHIERIARELGIGPIEFRLQNFVRIGERNPLSMNQDWILESCGIKECFEKGAEAIGYYEPRKPASSENNLRGIGFAVSMHVSGTSAEPDFSSAQVKINEDGTVIVLIGSPDLGQGSDTYHGQVAAEIVGVKMENVKVYSADTDFTSFDMGSYASRQSYVGGNAVKEAAKKAKAELLEFAAEMTGQDVRNLETADGWVVRRENERKVVKIKDVAHFAVYNARNRKFINATASYQALNCPPSFAVHFVELEIDKETGEITILKFVAAHDVGKAVNPALVEGQIEGSIAQGLGYSLTEDMIYNEQGKMLNANLTDYKVLRAKDMPKAQSIIIEDSDPTGPFGAKGVGEIGIAPAPGAIANAIYDATGVWIKDLPFTKEKILEAIRNSIQ